MNKQEIIEEIKSFPERLTTFAQTLTEDQLDTTIREGAWTIRQSINHLVDSHTHSYIRIKFALTEENPEVKPYEEKDWSKLVDCYEMPINYSLDIISGLHAKISYLLERINDFDWNRTLYQPELGKVDLKQYAERMAIHGQTHLKSIKSIF